jgi:membrane-bound ClpP family serine protease
MIVLAKGFEAMGIASLMIGLVEGIQSPTMWNELYLTIIGIVLFTVGRIMEKRIARRNPPQEPPGTTN